MWLKSANSDRKEARSQKQVFECARNQKQVFEWYPKGGNTHESQENT